MKYKKEPLQIGLKDSSAYVRKTAVMGVLKLHHTQPDIVDSKTLCSYYDSISLFCL